MELSSSEQNVENWDKNSIAALFECEELRLQLSFLDIKIHKETTQWTSIWIVSLKRKFILEVERLPDRVICPLLRYFKPMKAVCFVQFQEEIVLFSGSEWFIDMIYWRDLLAVEKYRNIEHCGARERKIFIFGLV